jgi:hypothetical protein
MIFKKFKSLKVFFGIIFLFLSLTTYYLLFTTSVSAAEIKDYTLLAPIPLDGQITSNLQGPDFFKDYIPGIFTTIIGLVAVLAVVRIIWGGILYISSDAINSKSDGKKMIIESIWGLVLIATAWLILYTINPKLVDINLSITPTTISTGATSLQPSTQSALSALTTDCSGCTINVTSTTGGSHDTTSLHYQGLAVDIAPNQQLTQYLTGATSNPAPCQRFAKYIGGQNAVFLWEPAGSTCGGSVPSSGDHWHMSVPQ